MTRIGSSSFTGSFVIRNDQRDTLATATLTSVCVDPKTRDKVPVPARFREAVEAFEGQLGDG